MRPEQRPKDKKNKNKEKKKKGNNKKSNIKKTKRKHNLEILVKISHLHRRQLKVKLHLSNN